MTRFRELREDGDPNPMAWKPHETAACPSRHFPPAGHEFILAGTPSGIAGDTAGAGMAVAIGEIGEPAVGVVQPRPI